MSSAEEAVTDPVAVAKEVAVAPAEQKPAKKHGGKKHKKHHHKEKKPKPADPEPLAAAAAAAEDGPTEKKDPTVAATAAAVPEEPAKKAEEEPAAAAAAVAGEDDDDDEKHKLERRRSRRMSRPPDFVHDTVEAAAMTPAAESARAPSPDVTPCPSEPNGDKEAEPAKAPAPDASDAVAAAESTAAEEKPRRRKKPVAATAALAGTHKKKKQQHGEAGVASAAAASSAAEEADRASGTSSSSTPGASPRGPEDLERAVQRFMRGLKSDFGAKRALDTFHVLCENEAYTRKLLQLDAIVHSEEMLLQLIHMVDVYLETPEVLRAIAFITRVESVASGFLKHGGLKLLLRAMTDKDAGLDASGQASADNVEAIAEHGCRILSNLTFSGLKFTPAQPASGTSTTPKDAQLQVDAKSELIRSVPLSLVIDNLRAYPKNVRLQMHGTNVLGVLALHSDSARDQMNAIGAVPCVLDAMREFPSILRMQEIGAWCLRTLSIGSKTRKQILDNGGIEVLVKAMSSFTTAEFMQVQATAALKQLASSDSRYIKFIEAGSIGAVVSTMNQFPRSEAVHQRCCCFLSVILENKKGREEIAKNDKLVPTLLKSLNKYIENQTIVEAVLVCFNYLAQHNAASLVAAIGDEKAMKKLLDGVNLAHPHNSRLASATKALTATLTASGACVIL